MAGVGVVVVLGQQVHVVEEDAAPVLVSQRLSHAHVQQLGAVERTVPPLDGEGRRYFFRIQGLKGFVEFSGNLLTVLIYLDSYCTGGGTSRTPHLAVRPRYPADLSEYKIELKNIIL